MKVLKFIDFLLESYLKYYHGTWCVDCPKENTEVQSAWETRTMNNSTKGMAKV